MREHLTALGDRVVLHGVRPDDDQALSELIGRAAPEAVYHLAGMSSVALSWSPPVLTGQLRSSPTERLPGCR